LKNRVEKRLRSACVFFLQESAKCSCLPEEFCVEFAPYCEYLARRLMNRKASAEAEFYMYAVFQSGGKQHRVSEGQTVRLEKLDIATGETIEFDQVLMIANGEDVKIGAPLVSGGVIKAEIVAHGRGEKIKIVKFRRRKHHRKQQGHRQWFTDVKITGISA
jgi:large subunit ribosomal protein L21